ncbi:SDR family oxidoreductase [Rhodococcus sp. 05-2256-B2]|uniref:SDR family NAD(P)-dependent oxidoreductase n=1 Tax=Nocardiaceae TaxID=85025 RepID=UPI00050CCF7A|nr:MULTISPECIES: SDR family NAD(P)-dependent oxidoreductase [Rhodococcus]OZD87650.1 SDR family oxidoreductase [Rhodococcus sp. 05-2256-B4]OZD89915.1 SDR family oxidoreductase [Rhodococcus sp. 05-2256-B2]OZD92233.1 SDR family oxidoreductase [Rhodococcus sp. 05-2256-B3]OZD98938.1 SDR family oxidoreductase [Rhodococcus sp. 05-2256-B1]
MGSRRVVVVTGAAQGIGHGVAERMAALGHQVVGLDHDASQLAKFTAAQGIHGIATDVSDDAQVADAIRSIEDEYGRLDVLVNNAGISPSHGGRSQPVEDIGLDEWDRVLAVNLTGTFLMCRAALPMMKRGRWGRIVNFSSQGGRTRSLLSGAHYGATKAGLIGFTRVLAGQVGQHGITANCVAPGRIDTLQSRSFGDAEAYAAQLPAGRLGVPDDIAAAVEYLISDGAGFVTGTVLDVNGGHFMP